MTNKQCVRSVFVFLSSLWCFSAPQWPTNVAADLTSRTNLRLTWAQVTPVHTFLTSSVAAVFVLQSVERFQPHWAEPSAAEFTAIYGVRLSGGRLGLNSAAVEPRQRENSSSERNPVLWEICQSRRILICISKHLQANPVGFVVQRLSYLCFGGTGASLCEWRRELFTFFFEYTWSVTQIKQNNIKKKKSVQRWHREQPPTPHPAGETKVQERCRFDREEKENTGAASGPEQFVWTETGAFPRGNRSWRENTGRQEHSERIKYATKFFCFFCFFLAGQVAKENPFLCLVWTQSGG